MVVVVFVWIHLCMRFIGTDALTGTDTLTGTDCASLALIAHQPHFDSVLECPQISETMGVSTWHLFAGCIKMGHLGRAEHFSATLSFYLFSTCPDPVVRSYATKPDSATIISFQYLES